MIPILYPAGETEFSNNGLGRLEDALECTVEEERNGKYELELSYPVSGRRFSDITHSRIIYAKPEDGADPQPFQIYKISKPMNGRIRVMAEHISYRLSHIPVSTLEATSCAEALNKLKSNAAEACPFTFWTDKSTVANFSVDQPSSIRSLLGGQRGSVLDVYGGEYQFDKFTVKLYDERGMDRGVTLRYGKNITDISQEENIQNTITGVYPFWRGNDTSGASELVELDEKVLHSDNAKNFPYQRTVPLDLSQDFGETKPTKEQLKTRAQAYMTANKVGIPSVSIKVSFVPLWQTEEYREAANLERVRLCDPVTVVFPQLEISATAKVVRIKYDSLKERYVEIELGDAKSNLGATIRGALDQLAEISTEEVRDAKSELRKAIKHATDLITGGLGGYVVFGRNADGEPEEILIMDKPSTETAVNVIRINKNGIGFSTNGYGGPFTNAWTIDGKLVADFITTGTLTAVLIKAGILSDVAGKNFWNMETGEFQLASTATVGGKTVDKIVSDAVEDYDDSVTQQMIFNRLTNNGQTQGIYLKDGKLYINATYIATGTLADVGNNTKFNLATGELTMTKGSINIGNGAFKVSETGKLTATGADISGTVKTEDGKLWTKMEGGYVYGGTTDYSSSSYTGYISFNQYHTNTGGYGTRIAGRSMIALLTPTLAVGGFAAATGAVTATAGSTKTFTVATGIGDVDVTVTPQFDHLYDVARVYVDSSGTVYLAAQYYTSVEYMKGCKVSVTVKPNTTQIGFTKGLMTTS